MNDKKKEQKGGEEKKNPAIKQAESGLGEELRGKGANKRADGEMWEKETTRGERLRPERMGIEK